MSNQLEDEDNLNKNIKLGGRGVPQTGGKKTEKCRNRGKTIDLTISLCRKKRSSHYRNNVFSRSKQKSRHMQNVKAKRMSSSLILPHVHKRHRETLCLTIPNSRVSRGRSPAEIDVLVRPRAADVIGPIDFAYRTFLGAMATAVTNRLMTSSCSR